MNIFKVAKIALGIFVGLKILTDNSTSHVNSMEQDNISRQYARDAMLDEALAKYPDQADRLVGIKLNADRWNADKMQYAHEDPITSFIAEMFK
jgi:GrpB-like predicted nucleotidyltransferase (UPF0157 family)